MTGGRHVQSVRWAECGRRNTDNGSPGGQYYGERSALSFFGFMGSLH